MENKRNRKEVVFSSFLLHSLVFFVYFSFIFTQPVYSLKVSHKNEIEYEFRLPVIVAINISEVQGLVSICYYPNVDPTRKECTITQCNTICTHNLEIRKNILFTNYTLEVSSSNESYRGSFELKMPTKPIVKINSLDFVDFSEIASQYNFSQIFLFNSSFYFVWYKSEIVKYGIYEIVDDNLIPIEEKTASTRDVVNFSFSLSRVKYESLRNERIIFAIFWKDDIIFRNDFILRGKKVFEEDFFEQLEEIEPLDYAELIVMKHFDLTLEEYNLIRNSRLKNQSLESFDLSKGIFDMKKIRSFVEPSRESRRYRLKYNREFDFETQEERLCDLEIERENVGKIKWLNCVDGKNVNFDYDILIEKNRISVNTKLAKGLDKEAILYFYNYSEDVVYVFKDGALCLDCEIIRRDFQEKIVEVKVKGFSSYEVGPNVTINLYGWTVQDTWFGVTGFRLNTTQTASTSNQYHQASVGNVPVHWGMRVFIINQSDPATWREMTSGTPYLLFTR
ncbi:MAG: hypothetical protein QXD62_03405, partial [Candidatus Woesearchaeota archaeon]